MIAIYETSDIILQYIYIERQIMELTVYNVRYH